MHVEAAALLARRHPGVMHVPDGFMMLRTIPSARKLPTHCELLYSCQRSMINVIAVVHTLYA
jgi:hypothetical protein